MQLPDGPLRFVSSAMGVYASFGTCVRWVRRRVCGHASVGACAASRECLYIFVCVCVCVRVCNVRMLATACARVRACVPCPEAGGDLQRKNSD
jgi:hypothetical protein